MTELADWLASLRASFVSGLRDFGGYLPDLLAALLLLLIGWFLARLARYAFGRLAQRLNRLFARVRGPSGRVKVQMSPAVAALAGNVVFWLLVLVFAALAARIAGLDAFTNWLDRIVGYLPTLLAGAFIALAGYLVSKLIRDVVEAMIESTGSEHGELIGFAAQGAVFLTAIVIGLDQIGIDVTLLIVLLAILVGGALLALVFAFGFGARAMVGNLIGAQQAQRYLRAGQYAEIDSVVGQVVEITPVSVILATEKGRLLVPARLFMEKATLLLADADDE